MKKFDFESVLSHLRPTKEDIESELHLANSIISNINSTISSLGYNDCSAVLTGSVAKGTFLRNKKDIDVFVLFPNSTPRENLESIILGIFLKSFPDTGYQLSYAEHPYVRFHYEGRRIDLVPAYKIENSDQRISAVDRSVLHTKFVNTNLRRAAIDDVLLLKAFLKANSLYGAEIKIQGFSGYLCELLIIKFGSFSKLLSAASKWNIKSKILFDLEKIYSTKKSKEEIQKKLGDFVFIDPTDPNRNVAAAVSKESLSKFAKLCSSFLKSPSGLWFLKQPESFESRVNKISKSGNVYILKIPKAQVVDDVLWGQIRKLNGQLERCLADFEPKSILADDNRHLVFIAICLTHNKLLSDMLIKGPPVSMKKNVLDFKKSHPRAQFSIKKGNIYAKVKRPIKDPEKAIRKFFESYSKSGSHLAVSDELLIVERFRLGHYKKKI
ncbi:MAG: CCA tRNA nucleotidyltransferase [Candidatus Bilamarchaeum sp.]|jgi:tRNA nucleotidyltransferase (CCA-adding enzyme)